MRRILLGLMILIGGATAGWAEGSSVYTDTDLKACGLHSQAEEGARGEACEPTTESVAPLTGQRADEQTADAARQTHRSERRVETTDEHVFSSSFHRRPRRPSIHHESSSEQSACSKIGFYVT